MASSNESAEIENYVEVLQKAYDGALEQHPNDASSRLFYFASHLGSEAPGVMTRAKSFFEDKEKARAAEDASDDIRVRDIAFGISSTTQVVVGDQVQVLRQRVQELFQWYDDTATRNYYAAPCMPIIQSSGTGKTKLLYDFRHSKENEDEGDESNKLLQDGHEVFLISCLPQDNRRNKDNKTFDRFLDFKGKNKEYFLEQLDECIRSAKKKNIVLLLDEAQELSRNNGKHMHTLRQFLRLKRKSTRVAAIFAGTNQSLANCYPTVEQRKSSREGEEKGNHYQCGESLYSPMYGLFTMGCFVGKITFEDGNKFTEFDRAIPYGRPLFARMLFAEEPPTGQNKITYPVKATRTISEEEMMIIATRMQINYLNPFESADTLLPFASVWATRVQLGNVQSAVVETLVAKGYAHLTSFAASKGNHGKKSDKEEDTEATPKPTVSFANLPDPVCARIAMCLMTEGWKLQWGRKKIEGKSKHDWTEKLQEIFSSGLCRPSRGDLGELASAAYLLFCGDLLRYQKDQSLKTFSVPVATWVYLLQNPVEGVSLEKGNDTDHCSTAASSSTINFIQFCRNTFRFGLKDVCNQSFLGYLYKSCCAVYAHEGCAMYDAFGSIRCTGNEGWCFVPLLVSIKTRENYTIGAAKKNIDKMVEELYVAGVTKALLLVVLLDNDAVGDNQKRNDAKKQKTEEEEEMDDQSVECLNKMQTRAAAASESWQAASKSQGSFQLNGVTPTLYPASFAFLRRMVLV